MDGSVGVNQIDRNRFWGGYKTHFLRTLPEKRGTIVVDESGSYAPSEGMGHAMFFAAEREDWDTFNSLIEGLANFSKANGMLRWKINADGTFPIGDTNLNSSTETEQNVANALLIAYKKTKNNRYLELALNLLDALWRNATIEFQGKRVILVSDLTENQYWPITFNQEGLHCKIADTGLSCHSIRSVVWSTAFSSPTNLRRFAEYDTKHDWGKAANDLYRLEELTLKASLKEPFKFGIVGQNPMPDYVNLIPEGKNEIGIDQNQAKLTFSDERAMDVLRLPIYFGPDTPISKSLLVNFYASMKLTGPESVQLEVKPQSGYDPGRIIAIGAYGAGIKAIGEDASKYLMELRIGENGSFAPEPSYYRDTICYYAYLIMSGLYPR